MSDFIEIEGISGFGYHGLFDHERRNGQSFSADVKLELKGKKASKSDEISDAVDYSEVIKLVHQIIIGEPVNLIEHLAENIANALLEEFSVTSVEVVLHKANAPVGLPVRDIAVRIKRSK